MPLTATFDPDHGYVTLLATGVPAGHFIYRMGPNGVYGPMLPAFDYTIDRTEQFAADYLVPIGVRVTYGLLTPEAAAKPVIDMADAVELAAISTPQNTAYLRHLFFPALGQPIRVVEFDDRRPGRLTTYAISGSRHSMATFDIRGGREGDLIIAVDGRDERATLERILDDGAPVSYAACAALGNEPGIYAVGDVDFTRYGTKDRWVVTLPLTEVAMPVVLGNLMAGDIPGLDDLTYTGRATFIKDGTYDQAAAVWSRYADAMVI